MRARILNGILFYVAWFSCVGGAAQGNTWLGPGVVAVTIGSQILLGWLPVRILYPALVSIGIGAVAESGFSLLGVYTLPDWEPWWPPAWLALLWPNFVAALPLAMNWLRGRVVLGALLGGLGGPASYFAGEKLGAIELQGSFALIVLGIVWAFCVPALDWLTAQFTGPHGGTREESPQGM